MLSIISRGETYGYEILSVLNESGFDTLIEGTLYPVLTRLQKKNLIACRVGKSPLGPSRKYFSITPEGETWLDEFIKNFSRVTNVAGKILSKKE